MEAFALHADRDGAHANYALVGELDDAASGRVRNIDLDGMAASGCRVLTVDLASLEFIDSSGIGSLVHLRNRTVSRGLAFEIGAMPVRIERTLVMAGLAELFDLNPTV